MSKETQNKATNTNSGCLKTTLIALFVLPLIFVGVFYIYFGFVRPRAGTGVTFRDQRVLDRFTILRESSTSKAYRETLPSDGDILLFRDRDFGSFLLTPLNDPKIISLEHTKKAEEERSNISQLFFTPESLWIAVYGDGTIEYESVIRTMLRPGYSVFSNNGKYGAVINDGFQLYIFEPDAYPLYDQRPALNYPTNAAAWSSDSSKLFFTTDSALYSTLPTGEQVDLLLTYSEIVPKAPPIITKQSRLFAVPNQEKLLLVAESAQGDNQIWAIDYQAKQVDMVYEAPLIQQVAVSPDASKLGFVNHNGVTALDISGLDSLNIELIHSIEGVIGDEPLLWTTDSQELVFRLNDPDTGCANVNRYEEVRGIVFPRFNSTKYSETVCFFEVATWDVELQDEPSILIRNVAVERALSNIVSYSTVD